MGYVKQNFKSGDVLMADQLNAMDEQISLNEQAIADKVSAASLSKVAATGRYNDLIDKPTLPTRTSELINDSEFVKSEDVPNALSELSDDINHRTVTDSEKSNWNAKSDFSGNYNDLSNKPNIPAAVTETTVSGWGFTKNAGTVTGVKINGAAKNPSNGIVDLGTIITSHQDISGKQDKLVSGQSIKTVNGQSILGEGNIEITGGGTIDTSDLLTKAEAEQTYQPKGNYITEHQKLKTVNGESLVGEGDITIEGGGTNKKSISILFVGNSLTQDGIAYLPYMLKTYYPEVDFKIYMWYTGGYTLGQHYETFTSGGYANIFSVAENSVSWNNFSKNKTMAQVLSSYTFDIVCMQEYFNYKEEYTSASDWNLCRDYIVSNYKGGNALEFISLFHAPLRKDGYDVNEVYSRTEDGNALILQTTISEDMIPNGIAVYRALSTDLNNLGDLKQLSPDGTHTQEGLPCLLQTYVTLCWLFDRLSINKSVYGHSMRMTTSIYNSINVPGANLGNGVVQGTDAQNLLAQEVAIKAYKEGKQFVNRHLYPYNDSVYVVFTITTNMQDATIKINGIEQDSIEVIKGSPVNWEVSKEGYHTQNGVEIVNKDTTKSVELMPLIELESITAEFTQGRRTIFNEDPLDDLRKNLVVTANYENGSSEIIEGYELSGTLVGGTSTITVLYCGLSTTFNVEVYEVSIPSEYTRYGWLSSNKTSKTGKLPSNYIYLEADQDWNRLSLECYIGKRPEITHASGSGLFGARLASSENENPWFGLYVPLENVRVDARGVLNKVPYPSDMSKMKVTLDNRRTSPMYASVNDGEPIATEWTTSDVINVPMSLLNNIPDGATTAMNYNIYFRIGEMRFRDYDGKCVYYYIPVTDSSNKIGMYDVVNQRFCTAATASAVTIGNSGCLHQVGNW